MSLPSYKEIEETLLPPNYNTEEKVVIHYIQKGETLTQLSLKYDCSKADIRKINKMSTDNLISYNTLLIPTKYYYKCVPPDEGIKSN